MRTTISRFMTVLAFASTVAVPVKAAQLITNGGFSSGFAGWSKADAAGGDGTFFLQSGTLSPVNGDAVPSPPGPVAAAMSDGGGPGSHVLYQDFVIGGAASQFILQFDLFIGNRAGQFATPGNGTLDFGINGPNQQVRVDILRTSAGIFSVAGSDVLQNIYQSSAGLPLVSGYTTVAVDVSALANANFGNTLRLRFAETDNLAQLQAGVDNVSLQSVPEPSSVLLGSAGCLVGLAAVLRKRRR